MNERNGYSRLGEIEKSGILPLIKLSYGSTNKRKALHDIEKKLQNKL